MGSTVPASVEIGGYSVTATNESAESMTEALTPPEEKKAKEDEVKKAASELGRKGGNATAAIKAKEAREAKKAEKEALKEEKPEADETKEAAPADKEGSAEPEEAKDEEKDPKKGDPRHDPKARMLEATRKEAEAKRELAREREERARDRAEIDRLRREFEGLKPKAEPPAPARGEDKPKLEDFEDYEKYLDARDEWTRKQTLKDIQGKIERDERDEKVAAAHNSFAEKMAPHREKIPVYMMGLKTSFNKAEGEVEGSLNWIANELVFSDNPDMSAQVALHLAEHEDEFQRIAALSSPRAVSRAMAKIEARLEAATQSTSPESETKDEPAERPVSKAAPPVRPVTGSPSVTTAPAEYREGMSFDEFMRVMGKPKRK